MVYVCDLHIGLLGVFNFCQIHAVKWSADDAKVVSCDTHGAVYEWNLSKGRKDSECVLKSCAYSSIALSSDAKIIFAVGSDQTLKEISESSVSFRGIFLRSLGRTLVLSVLVCLSSMW